MGLRMKKGINLKNTKNLKAYNYFKSKLDNVYVKSNHLIAKNINCLDEILIKLI
jgi:hypothetical protein